MIKKFWLSRLLGKFGKKDKVVAESVVEETTIEEPTIEEPKVEEPKVEKDQEVEKKVRVLTAEEKRRVRILRYLGYQD